MSCGCSTIPAATATASTACVDIGNRPLLLLAVLAILSGVQLFSFGLLAELQMRTYHESQGRPIYRVRATVRGGRAAGVAEA